MTNLQKTLKILIKALKNTSVVQFDYKYSTSLASIHRKNRQFNLGRTRCNKTERKGTGDRISVEYNLLITKDASLHERIFRIMKEPAFIL